MSEVGADLSCGWHTVTDAVVVYGTPLIDDPARFDVVSAVGLDERLFAQHPTPRCPSRGAGSAARSAADVTRSWPGIAPTSRTAEAVNNLIKRVKRVAFGFRRLAHYGIRSLLYAGRPNWNILDTLTPP